MLVSLTPMAAHSIKPEVISTTTIAHVRRLVTLLSVSALESSRKNSSIFVARRDPSGAMDPRWQPAPGTAMAPGAGPVYPHMQNPYTGAITNGPTQGHGRQDAHWQQQYAPGAGTVSMLPPADHHWHSSGSARPMPERASTDGVNHPAHYELCRLLTTLFFRSLDRCLAESVN